MISDLAQVFINFLTDITNANQWTSIYIGLIIFIIILDLLCNLIRGCK